MSKLSEFASEIAEARYFNEGENWEECAHRVAGAIGVDIGEDIFDLKFLPGGRILRNAGRPKGSLFNCYVVPIGDSILEIGKYYLDALQLWSEGGGVGTNLSALRPKGDLILGKGGQSSGPVSFIKAGDSVASTIQSGGQRRAAALACMDVSHPDIMDFITCKGEPHLKILSHYNLSVIINNSFLDSVEEDRDLELKFRGKSYRTVPARMVWEMVLDGMINSGEPGLLNGTNLMKNNSYYFAPVISTNPCGEVPLEPYGVCCLGSIVLPNFLTTKQTRWQDMERVIENAVRFLDTVIDKNVFVLNKNEQAAHRSRRIGLGVMGLAEYLFAKQVKYGSPEAMVEVERLMKFIRDCSYQASIKLAAEKGAFSAFDTKSYVSGSFVKRLPARLRMDIKKHGIRNVTVNAVAPTGTIALVADVTSSIEPAFALEYTRRDRVSTRTYRHPILASIHEGDSWPEHIVSALEISPEAHIETQATVQKYIDGAVSKTINLPKTATTKDLSDLLLEYARDLKGITVYRDGSREGQVLDPNCPTGQCEI